jgi:hypothetical protein
MLVRQFRQQSVGGDIASVQPDSVSWCEDWSRLMLMVVVYGILILCLCKCYFHFLKSLCYAFCKFIDQLQVRAWLLGIKAHTRVSSGVNHKGGLCQGTPVASTSDWPRPP